MKKFCISHKKQKENNDHNHAEHSPFPNNLR